MKVEIKKLSCGIEEWLIIVDGNTISIAFTKKDAKFLAKCIKKYNKEYGKR